jgi:hypothetical protein
MFSPLFVLIAIQVLLKGRSFLHIASAGFFCALASYFTQQRGLIAVASIGAFIIADNYYRGWRWKTAAAESATLVVGFTTSLAALCAYFVATAGFDTFVNSTLVYPSLYYQFNEQNNYGVFLVNLQSALNAGGPGQMLAILPALFYSFAVPLSIIIFAVVFFLKRKAHDWEFWRGPVLIAMVAGFAVFSMTNPSYLRFYQISAPCLVLVGWLLHYFGFSARRERLVFALTGLLLLFCAFQAYRIQTNWDYIEIDAPRGKVYALNSDQIHRYLWLQQHTTPGDAVFEVYEPLVYFLLDLRNPTRYTQIFPTDYTRPEFVAGAVEDLKKDPPRYILWDNSYNKPDSERVPGDHLGPLADYLQGEYEPTGPVYYVNPAQPPIQIWVRKGN